MNVQEVLEYYKAQEETEVDFNSEEAQRRAIVMKSLARDIKEEPVDVNKCPYCGKSFMIKTNFCGDCGQALR